MPNNLMLRSINKAAQEVFDTIGYPTKKDEHWKYCDLSSFKSKSFRISESFSSDNKQLLFNNRNHFNTLVIINGKLIIKDIVDKDKKIEINTISNILKNDNSLLHSLKHTDLSNPFLIMNSAQLSDGVHIKIPKNMLCDGPIYITSISSDKMEFHSNYSRIHIHAEAGSKATIIEHNIYSNHREYYKNKVLQVNAEQDSTIKHINIELN